MATCRESNKLLTEKGFLSTMTRNSDTRKGVEKMAKHTGLVQRKGRYYYRRRVPIELVEALEKPEVKYALGTSDFREATRRALVKALEVDHNGF